MREREAERLRLFARERDYARELLLGELRRGATAIAVAQHVDDQCLEVRIRHLLRFGAEQSPVRL
jgi:hypothetical protein